LQAWIRKGERFRTISEVAEDTDMPPEKIERILEAISQNGFQGIVQSQERTYENEELFTTQKHFDEETAAWDKFLGALRLKTF
jgi:hypothetical protein